MKTRAFPIISLLLTLLPALVAAGELTISDAWIRAAPPGASMLAGYARLRNAGDGDVRLVSVSSERFNLVEIHRTVEIDGMARMREVDAVDLPAGGEVLLAPGGLHLMLMRPQGDIVEGEYIVMRLHFDDGKDREAEFIVRRNAVHQAN